MREAFIAAFDAWEQDFRENPSDYMTDDEIAGMELLPLAEARTVCFVAILDKLADGKPKHARRTDGVLRFK